ncbi:MAG: ion channel [Terrimicrobiaceae bacterium]
MTAPHRVRAIYACSIFLAGVLFAFHSLILIETGRFLVEVRPWVDEVAGLRLSGPVLVFAAFMILFCTHMVEAWAWGAFFRLLGQFNSIGEAIYFSGTSLTALGYGDLVLRPPWQRLGPVMATNGILMYGCSTAFLFLIIQKVWSFGG